MLTTMLVGSLSAKEIDGVGEYRYGPQTSEAFACHIAEEKAKEDLIIKVNGLFIQHQIDEQCLNEECRIERYTFQNLKGVLQSIYNKETEHYVELGHRVCKVSLTGSVSQTKSEVAVSINGSLDRKHDEVFDLSFTTNTAGGDLFVFNLYNDRYERVFSLLNVLKHREMKIGSFRAIVPEGLYESHEKLKFLYVMDHLETKESYSIGEMDVMLSSIKPERKFVVMKTLTIRR